MKVRRVDEDTPTTSCSANISPQGLVSKEEEEVDLWCLARLFNQADLGEASEVADQGLTDIQEAEAKSLPDEDEPMKQPEGITEATRDKVLLERDSHISSGAEGASRGSSVCS